MAAASKFKKRPFSAFDKAALPPATEKDVRVRVYQGHSGTVYRVAMPMDGRFAMTSSEDGTVRQWDLAGEIDLGEVVLKGDVSIIGLAVSADGMWTAAGDRKGRIHVWPCASDGAIRQWQAHKMRIGNIAFLKDGRELVTAAHDGYLRRWRPATGHQLAQCRVSHPMVFGVATTCDGKCIIGASTDNGLVRWSGNSKQPESEWDLKEVTAASVSLTANGHLAYSGTKDGKVACSNVDEGEWISTFEGHSGAVWAVAVTPDGRFCVSGAADQTVRLWAAHSGQCLAILKGHEAGIGGIAITPDGRRIASVAGDKTLRVWDIPDHILARAEDTTKRGYMNAKVVLLGEPRVGKTGLANRLWHDTWQVTDSTHGMEVRRLALGKMPGGDEIQREVWLWDLAGQPEYRLTHQLFMEQTSLAVVVVDRQREDWFESAKYWQQALRKLAAKANPTCILVAGRCDEPGQKCSEEEMREWAKQHGFVGPVFTAAKKKGHPGTSELRGLIERMIHWNGMEFRAAPANFTPLKDAVLSLRDKEGKGGVVVTPDELENRVRATAKGLDFTTDDLAGVTSVLAGEGVLHALPYGRLIVLQPSWVNGYASSLVKLAGEAKNRLGHVPMDLIQPGKLPKDGTPRLSLEDERQFLPALVELFLHRALAWKQDTDKGTMLVFPNYVRMPREAPPPRPGKTVVYRFTGALEAIYCTLVVRLHYSGLFADTKLYRDSVDFFTASGKQAALTLRGVGEQGELDVYFGDKLDVDVQAAFEKFVNAHLKAKATSLIRLRNYFCPKAKCGKEVTDRQAIDAALANKQKHIFCVSCGTKVILRDTLETQLTSSAGEAKANEARRTADEAITSASKEGIMVGEVGNIVFSVDQIYRTQAQPDVGVDGMIEFRDDKKQASGHTYRVQLKSGDSHLKKLKGGREVFAMKAHYATHWTAKGEPDVLLIVRDSEGSTRYMNATKAIRAVQKKTGKKAVKQIDFVGLPFDKKAVLELREQRLG